MPPEKQKILYKGKVIKEDSQLKTLDIPDGSTVMLMGSAEGKAMDIENIQSKMFIEELTPEQRALFYKETMGVFLCDSDRHSIWTRQSRQHMLYQFDYSSSS